MIAEIDSSIRKLLSFFFRVLIIAYSIMVLILSHNFFEWYIYLIAFIIHGVIYFLCFGKDGKLKLHPLIRLINDYALFYVVLFDKNLNEPFTFLLLLLPIINALNHSGERRAGRHSMPMYVIAILSIYLLSDSGLTFKMIVMILSLALINLFLHMRLTILNYVEKLNSTFEDFNIGTEEARKHHQLLINLVQKFSELPLTLRFILFTPNSLVSYRVIRNKLLVKSSANFIFQANFDNEDKLIEELQKNGISFNHPTKLDQINSPHNVFVSVKIQNSTYVFMFTVGKDIKSQLNKYFIEKYLKSPLVKVAKIIDYENKLKGERRKILEQYKSKFKMLEDTRDTLHLVKNKLTPVYTYFDLLNRQKEKGNDYSNELQKLKVRIASNLKIIKDNSTPYLERQLNPHDSESQQMIGLKKLYGIIIDSFQEEMESEFVLRIGDTEGIDRFAKINLEMLYFLLSEIAMNTDEHSIENSVELYFDFKQEELVLTISNRVKNAKNKELILKSFNKEELSLILEKNFNGLTILKKYLLKMGILHFLHIDDNVFKLELKIPTYENIDI